MTRCAWENRRNNPCRDVVEYRIEGAEIVQQHSCSIHIGRIVRQLAAVCPVMVTLVR